MSPSDPKTVETLRNLAKVLNELAEREARDESSTHEVRELEHEYPSLARIAQAEYRARRDRELYFEGPLFGEPAWDILLDLFFHAADGKQVSSTSAGIASGAPLATAHRYLALLEREGLIERQASGADRRVTYVRLTLDGFRRVGNYLKDRRQKIEALGLALSERAANRDP
ncbi:MAG: helix-turn-helix domain-containing protein [Croceibacterium sp.]